MAKVDIIGHLLATPLVQGALHVLSVLHVLGVLHVLSVLGDHDEPHVCCAMKYQNSR